MEHVDIPLGKIHKAHNFEFADAAARIAADISDDVLVGGLALQLDDGSFWRLIGVAPLAWEPARAAPTQHEHPISDVTGLQAALNGKSATGHAHAISDVTGLQAALNGKEVSGAAATAVTAHEGATDPHPQYARDDDARFSDARTPTAHTHAIADVTGLQGTLDALAHKVAPVLVADDVAISPAIVSDNRTIVQQVNTQATGALTFNNPTGVPLDGQQLQFRVTCANVQTPAFDTAYRPTNLTFPAAMTGGGKTDRLLFEFNAAAAKWDLIGIAFGA